jgi:hypothetical protein
LETEEKPITVQSSAEHTLRGGSAAPAPTAEATACDTSALKLLSLLSADVGAMILGVDDGDGAGTGAGTGACPCAPSPTLAPAPAPAPAPADAMPLRRSRCFLHKPLLRAKFLQSGSVQSFREGSPAPLFARELEVTLLVVLAKESAGGAATEVCGGSVDDAMEAVNTLACSVV